MNLRSVYFSVEGGIQSSPFLDLFFSTAVVAVDVPERIDPVAWECFQDSFQAEKKDYYRDWPSPEVAFFAFRP